jgi:SAM-dependent methyltransferase
VSIGTPKTGTELVVQHPREYWWQPDIADEYENRRFSSRWGRLYRWLEERAIQRALRGQQLGSRVLDVPCGTGRVTALLVKNGFEASGCDISPAMLQVARRQLAPFIPASSLVESDIEHLPYPDESFDAVTCIGLLMHFDATARVSALRELRRVSRRCIVAQYGCPGALLRSVSRLTGRVPGGVLHPISTLEMRRDFERSGLTERARFWVLRPFSSSVVVLLTK